MTTQKPSARGRGIIAVLVLGLTGIFFAIASDSTYRAAYVDAVWVAQKNTLSKYSSESGELLFDIPDLKGLRQIAVDSHNGKVWAALKQELRQYDFTGQLVTTIPFPAAPGEDDSDKSELEVEQLFVDATDQSLWLTTEKSLYHYDVHGVLQNSVTVEVEIESVAISAAKGKVWIAGEDVIRVYPITLNEKERDIRLSDENRDEIKQIARDPVLDQLWVNSGKILFRLDDQDNIVFEKRIKQLDKFALDGQGNAWLSTKKSLIYLTGQGQELVNLEPFGKKGEQNIHQLAVDPADQSVWASGKEILIHLSLTGEILQQFITHDKIQDIALYRDTVAPTIQFVLPTEGSITNNPSPTIQVLHQDEGIGVDSQTLTISRDSNPLPVSCTHSLDTSVCEPANPFADGEVSLEATVKDYAGNVAEPAVVNFSVDTVPPELNILEPENNSYTNNKNLLIRGSVNEQAAITVNNEAVELADDFTFSHEDELSEGENHYDIRAVDLAVNMTQASYKVVLDTVPPQPPQANKIIIGDVVAGETTVASVAGSVEPDSRVRITNARTGKEAQGQADGEGQFSITLGALPGDILQVVVIDRAENSSAAISLQVPVPLSINISYPLDGSIVHGKSVFVEGTYHGLLNTGITVNGEPVAVMPEGKFASQEIALQAGVNTLKVVATTLTGLSMEKIIAVTSDGADIPLEFTPDAYAGTAPLNVAFDFAWHGPQDIQSIEIDFNSDGVPEIAGTAAQETYRTTYHNPGMYHANIVVTDVDNRQFTKTLLIQVQNPNTMDQLFKATWSSMNTMLVNGDIATASNYLDDYGKRKYRPIFEVLLDKMPQIIASYTSFKKVDINSEVTIYALNRPDGTRNRVYFVYFMQDRTGIWKVHSM